MRDVRPIARRRTPRFASSLDLAGEPLKQERWR